MQIPFQAIPHTKKGGIIQLVKSRQVQLTLRGLGVSDGEAAGEEELEAVRMGVRGEEEGWTRIWASLMLSTSLALLVSSGV